MHQLMATVVAIALTAAALVSSLTYVNPSKVIAREMGMRFEQAYGDLQKGYNAYVLKNAAKPSSLGELTPAYAFIPPAPEGMSWSFGVGGENNGGRWFCLSGNASRESLAGIERLHSAFSPQAYFVSDACGALENESPVPGSNGRADVAATYWVSSYVQG